MNKFSIALASAASLALVACGDPAEEYPEEDAMSADQMAMDEAATAGTVVEVAQGNPVRVRIPLEGPVEGALISRLL